MNLLVFARTLERKSVTVHHYGFDYAKKKWEPEQDTPEVRQAWHKAALSTAKREILIAKLGKEVFVFIDFEGKGTSWEPTRIKGKPRNTKQEDARLNREAKKLTIRGNQADSDALDALLRSTLGRPLVVSPDGQKLIPMPEADSSTTVDEITSMLVKEKERVADLSSEQGFELVEEPQLSSDASQAQVTSQPLAMERVADSAITVSQNSDPSSADSAVKRGEKGKTSKKKIRTSSGKRSGADQTQRLDEPSSKVDDVDDNEDFWSSF